MPTVSDIGGSRQHGEQWFACLQPGKHAATKYRGVFPGTVEARKRSWTLSVDCGTMPDLIRVDGELHWDPDTEMFQAHKASM